MAKNNFIEPRNTRSRVAAAGRRFRDHRATEEDAAVIENWRAAHAYVLNTFQNNLRARARGIGATVAQRLKRRVTIFDKLQREPNMALSHMHDIAGCRVIFDSIEELTNFRASLHESRAQHRLIGRDVDQYNYLIRPKHTGYRGVHDVYAYEVSSEAGKLWNGLMVEIQYRTQVQHAWATAVEVADLTTSSRIKFDQGTGAHRDFFRLASELLARAFEGSSSCCPEMSNPELGKAFVDVAVKSGLWVTLNRLRAIPAEPSERRNAILVYYLDEQIELDERLRVFRYENTIKAIHEYGRLEKELDGKADVVLVRASTDGSIREAYRNYYSDVEAFLTYIRSSLERLLDETGGREAISILTVDQHLPRTTFASSTR